MRQRDTRDEAVPHTDRLAVPIECASHTGSQPGGMPVQWQYVQRARELPDGISTLSFSGATQEFETGDRGGLQPSGCGISGNL